MAATLGACGGDDESAAQKSALDGGADASEDVYGSFDAAKDAARDSSLDRGADDAAPDSSDAEASVETDAELDAPDGEDAPIEAEAGPTSLAQGEACADAGLPCASGHCVDGVCCDTSCAGTCERCDSTAAPGVCTPSESGQDPDVECAGTDSQCAGTCDGLGACAFPTTSCGDPSCQGQNSEQPTCDGAGSCIVVSQDCSLSGYCGSTGLCAARKPKGSSCTLALECDSGQCIDGVCCATSCAAPNSCTTGDCLCNGQACTTGASCILFYPDGDGDGYGVSGANVYGCSNTTRVGYARSTNPQDCYDGNANAKPGSTFSSATHRGDGSFDYNCDNVATRVYTTLVTGSCQRCANYIPTCSACYTPLQATCLSGFLNCYVAYDGCQTTCPVSGFNYALEEGFKTVPDCGQPGTWYSCASLISTNACGPVEERTQSRTQLCY